MKKTLYLVMLLVAALLTAACGASTAANTGTDAAPKETAAAQKEGAGRILVAYFSGTGNTSVLAHHAANVLGADIFEIRPVVTYTSDDLSYVNPASRATKEQNDASVRPEIAARIENFADYDTIVLAFPIWWGQEPRIIDTFVESYDFSGKTVAPICTSGSSDIDAAAAAIAINATGAVDWKDGRRFTSSTPPEELADWFKEIGLMK